MPDMPPRITPNNFGLTYRGALILAIVGGCLALLGLGIAVLYFDLNERTTGTIATILGLFGVVLTALISALKSNETADTSAKALQGVEDLKFQMRQTLQEHQQTRRFLEGNGGHK